jgi:hypothetical protein
VTLTEAGDERQRVGTTTVDLDIPTSGDLLTLARLTAATLASRTGFNVEEIEDLRLAVDELCLPILRASSRGRLKLRYATDDGTVHIACTFLADAKVDDHPGPGSSHQAGPKGTHPEDALSACILDALVDEHGAIDSDHPSMGHWLRKRRSSTTF